MNYKNSDFCFCTINISLIDNIALIFSFLVIFTTSYEKQKVCHICENKFCDDKNKKSEYDLYHKAGDHCHYTGKFEELLIIFAI